MHVALHFDYPVIFTTDVFFAENPVLVDAIARKEPGRRHRLLVVLERAVADLWAHLASDIQRYAGRHADRLDLVDAPLVIAGGEAAKNTIATPLALAERFHDLRMDRQSFVVTVGGGALQDMVGFAASITHRGLRIVRIPTTVLAQADSGVGVKNGINAFGKKNFLGTFAPPFAVLNDRRFLETLPKRDRIAGMAEAVKVALIRDSSFFEWVQKSADALANADPEAVDFLVRRSAELHLDHIARAGDPFELGTARPLDFGHWSAHKLESLSDYELRHGEAVAIGVALDTFYSVECGFLDRAALEPVASTLERLGFRLWDGGLDLESEGGARLVLDGLAEFKEHLGGELTVTLLGEVGRGFETHEIETEVVLAGIEWLRSRDRGH